MPILLPAAPAGYTPKSVEQLAKESVAIVETKLVRVGSYLWRSNDRVLTDYSFEQPTAIAGTIPALVASKAGATPQLILTVYGGEILLNGVTVRAPDDNREAIDERATFLLFLKESRAGAGHYEIYDGAIFEVRGTRLRPLARNGGDIFKWASNASRAEVLAAIRGAVSSR